MCGIFGYVGKRRALAPVILEGLARLEYRGYDSAGLVVIGVEAAPKALKKAGSVAQLRRKVRGDWQGTVGLGHTRWATHGAPNDANAHPHTDCQGTIWLVHNGIIENYETLKQGLEERGHIFTSDTDSEVLAHVIEESYSSSKLKKGTHALRDAVKSALVLTRGAYAIAVAARDDPDHMVAARLSSPLLIGVGMEGMFLASDAAALVAHTKQVVYIEDGEIAELTPKGYRIQTVRSKRIKRAPTLIDWDIEEAEKGGYEHFFIKEIFEQPEAARNSMRGRITPEGTVKLGGLEPVLKSLGKAERVLFLGCGTAAVAGLVGKYLLEEIAGLAADTEIASEFRYRNPVVTPQSVAVAISQSGETADTLAALRLAKGQHALSIGIVNVVGSTISRLTDAGVYNHVGPEISVASTKAFTSQIIILVLFALLLAEQRGVNTHYKQVAKALATLPKAVSKALGVASHIRKIARKYKNAQGALYIGRKYSYPVALEGAIKLKEVTYVHAEGMTAGEIKHHSIAMIDKQFLSVCVAPKDSVYEKTLNNIKEIKARDGRVFAVTTEGNTELEKLADDVVYVPSVPEALSPVVSVVPLQLFAYYMGVERGVNLDKPRNLAKSVTVE